MKVLLTGINMKSRPQADNDVMEEETYQKIISAIQHPVRRRILRMLLESPKRFSEFIDDLKITGASLSYHLSKLGELIACKNSDYHLSVFGTAAVNLMEQIEEPKQVALLSRSIQQHHPIKHEILDDYKLKHDWFRFKTNAIIFFYCAVISFGVTQFLNLRMIAPDNLMIEIYLQLFYLIPPFVLISLRIWFPQLKRLSKRDKRNMLFTVSVVLTVFLITLTAEFANGLSQSGLANTPLWPLIRASIYFYFTLLYPLMLTIGIWTTVRETVQERFQNDFIADYSERFSFLPNEVETMIRNKPLQTIPRKNTE